MNKFFNFDNPVMSFLGKLADVFWLNILWVVTSLPIFTIGASTSALYRVTLKLANDDAVHTTKEYFNAFKSNFKKGTILGLIMIAVGAILGFDGFYFVKMYAHGIIWNIAAVIFFVAVFLYLIILVYVFPLQATFENTIWNMIKNSILIGLRYLGVTVTVVVIYAVILGVGIRLFTPLLFLGVAFCAFLSSYFFRDVFKKIMPAEDETEEDDQANATLADGTPVYPPTGSYGTFGSENAPTDFRQFSKDRAGDDEE